LAEKYVGVSSLEKFENNVFKTLGLVTACQKSDTKIVINRRLSRHENTVDFSVLRYINQDKEFKNLKLGILNYLNFAEIEQSDLSGYIEDVVYANASLATRDFLRREITIR